MLQISHTIENLEIDAEIEEIFRSHKLAKKFLCYKLDGKLYNVLIIHNPEKVKLTSSKKVFNTSEHGPLSFVASCNKKVCIFVDKKAPRGLIKHISSFHNLSWWSRCWNFFISNGTKILYLAHEKKRFSLESTTYVYHPCSWYEAMVDATP